MDFQRQINEALDRSTPVRYKSTIATAIVISLAIGAGGLWLSQRAATSILAHGTSRLAEKKDTIAENLRKYQLLASTLSTEIEQLRNENTELNRKIHLVEIQITEAKKQADTAKGLTEQLSDANAELDQAQARIKSLTAELDALRQAINPSSKPLARGY